MISIADKAPELVKEWHPTKNGDKTPYNVSYGSDYKAHWICSACQHEWSVRVANRTSKGTNCPMCQRRWNKSFPELALFYYIKKIIKDTVLESSLSIKRFQSVDIFIPSLKTVIEYDGVYHHRNRYEKDLEKTNELLKRGFKVIRVREAGLDSLPKMPKLHIYQYQRDGNKSINLMVKSVLNILSNISNSFSEVLLKEIIKDINVSKDTLNILSQVPPVKVEGNLLEKNPAVAAEWNYERNKPFTPEHFKAGSNYKVWWICPKGHEYDAQINSRTKGHGCRMCAGQEASKENCLQTLYPHIAKEWDFENNKDVTPESITAHSNQEVYWICPVCKSSYNKSVNARTRKDKPENCPYCRGYRVNETNSLAVKRPDLAKEWHPTKNDKTPHEVSTGSHYTAYWICERGHTYQSEVYSRNDGRDCPTCYEIYGRKKPRKVPVEKSVARKKPFLLKQWDYEKNELSPEEVGAYARQMIWWKCSNGCSWTDQPNRRKSSKCKKCGVKD